MCRALTGALVGKRLNAITMSFDELLEEQAGRVMPVVLGRA
jgi:hypothetical protein